MDSLIFFGVIFAAGVAIGGIVWYQAKRQRIIRKRARAKQPRQTEKSIDKIVTTTKKRVAQAQTMEEAFAAGKEGLNSITKQIKESRHQKRRGK